MKGNLTKNRGGLGISLRGGISKAPTKYTGNLKGTLNVKQGVPDRGKAMLGKHRGK